MMGGRSRWPVMIAMAIGVLANWPMLSVAAAHANLLAASPAVGQSAGGSIERIQLVFDEPVTDVVASVVDPDDQPVPASVVEITPQQIDLALDAPLEVEGRYLVRYEFSSVDGDRVELGHAFLFDPTAPAPLPITGPVLVADAGTPWRARAAIATLAVVVAGLGLRLRRRRRALALISA